MHRSHFVAWNGLSEHRLIRIRTLFLLLRGQKSHGILILEDFRFCVGAQDLTALECDCFALQLRGRVHDCGAARPQPHPYPGSPHKRTEICLLRVETSHLDSLIFVMREKTHKSFDRY